MALFTCSAIMVVWISLALGALANPCPQLAPLCFCDNKRTSINCEGKGLTSLPSGIPSTVEKLYLGHNRFTILTTSMFKNLTSLSYLDLQFNSISVIQPFAFANLADLETLDMRNNKILELGPNAMSGMKGLTNLILKNNRIQNVSELAFDGTQSLESVDLQVNKLSEVPALGRQPRLVSLILAANGIVNATFPRSYSDCKKLSSIVLSSNSIRILTNETFVALTNNSITKLRLAPNKISNIEANAFAPLSTLLSLNLGYNPLDSNALRMGLYGLKGKSLQSINIAHLSLAGNLPSDTFRLLANTTLTFLLMSNNKIQKIPDAAFSQLNSLLTLDLSNNDIKIISDHAFEGLGSLQNLLLYKNKLTDVPKNLPGQLLQLDLYSNQIMQINNGAFQNLASLQQLSLRWNKILTLMQDSFVGLANLQKLYLSFNEINTLPSQVFSSLVHLISLDLSNNKLLQIQQQSFQSQGALVSLTLANNQLGTFPISLLNPLTSLIFLHLEGNNIGDLLNNDKSGSMFKGLRKLEVLYIMNNAISRLSDPVFQDLSSLKTLNASGNKISKWAPNTFRNSRKLRSLDLSFNLVSVIKEDEMKELQLDYFNLSGNPFACTCDLRWFRDWMKLNKTNLTNVENYTCYTPKEWFGKKLLTFDKTKIDCMLFTITTVIGITVPAVIVPIIVGVIVYRNRWRIWLRVYRMTKRSRRTRGKEYQEIRGEMRTYDAYISCAEEDKEWVLRHLLPDIDAGQLDDNNKFGGEFRLYFDDRDSTPGWSKVGNISENLEASRKMIVVLSRHYLNQLNDLELDYACERKYDGLLEDIIVVKIDQGLRAKQVPKRLYRDMRTEKFLEWEPNEDVVRAFKERLRNRLRQAHVEDV